MTWYSIQITISSMRCSLMHSDIQQNRPKICFGLSLVQMFVFSVDRSIQFFYVFTQLKVTIVMATFCPDMLS